jgi:hypothetical protein
MRPSKFDASSLRSFLKINVVATMIQLKQALGTSVDMTVYRKLRRLSYHSSYSHNGKFYTLDELAQFDKHGLWVYGEARFSKYGTLVQTAKTLIDRAATGYTPRELHAVVGVNVKETLLQLFRQRLVHREEIAGRFVYFASSPQQQRVQHLSRLERQPRLATAETEAVLAHEVRAAIVLFFSLLDEKQRRLYAGLESLRIGHGGDSMISRLLQVDAHTVARGRRELIERDTEIERTRRKGGGRHGVKKNAAID